MPSTDTSSPTQTEKTPRLFLRNISKRYPSVLANDDVSLSIFPGEIHAVLGENGAGKSTLMKIIYGAVQADQGQIEFDGKPVLISSPQVAHQLGISMVFQHFSLFGAMTVAQNVWLGQHAGQTLAEIRLRILEKATAYGLDIDPDRPVHTLSVGEMQRVEIIRALLGQPKLLILDEPTSVLTPQAVDKLFAVLRQLAREGCAILYISHKLDEIRVLCDTCTVMRSGKVTGVCIPNQETNASLSQLMIGKEPAPLEHAVVPAGEIRLLCNRLSLPRSDPFGVDLVNVQMQVSAGEILGIAGISGNGQRELMQALSGETQGLPANSLWLMGQPAQAATVHQRRDMGLHNVPEERLGRGAVPALSLAQNTLLSREEPLTKRFGLSWINPQVLSQMTEKILTRFDVKASGSQALASSLSGGNLQKYIMGRAIDANPRILLISQPTWGVDVGAATQIRTEILRLRQMGCAILIVSEELDELFDLCDRIQVMAKGRLSPSLPRRDANTQLIGTWMSGLWEIEPDA